MKTKFACAAALGLTLAFAAGVRAQSMSAASTPPAAGGFGRIDVDGGIEATEIELIALPQSVAAAPGQAAMESSGSVWNGRAALAAGASASLADRALIICWHTFLGVKNVPTDFSNDELARQLDSILELGYHFIDLRDALAGRFSGKLNVVATIDDGHRTVPFAVEKIFLPRGIRPALFLYPAVIGTTDFSMKDSDVARLETLGCWTGSHGYHHLFITEELYRTDRQNFDKEIFKSRLKTAELTGEPVLCIAYPYGALSAVTKQEVKRAGYSYGLSVRDGFIYADPRLNDEFELPRFVVTRDNWAGLIALLRRNAAQ